MMSPSSSAILPSLVGRALPLRLRVMIGERVLAGIARGRLTILLPDGTRLQNAIREPGREAELRIVHWRALARLVLDGDVGFARGYVEGDWDSPDLVALLGLCADNSDGLAQLIRGSGPAVAARRVFKALRRNTKTGSRRNIMAHYDLGNPFFASWLDADMIYSSALYEAADDTLEIAQRRKLDRITELLKLDGAPSVLEIGCGWGALAAHLGRAGAGSVHGITISPAQLASAEERVSGQGLADWVKLELRDYRDVAERYDRVVSIEMFEAVGEAYWPTYFDAVRKALKPGGRAVIQVITIAEDRFDDYRSHPDMIQTMVFPGGMLPSERAMEAAANRAGLALSETHRFGPSYARTLDAWNQRFQAAWPALQALGYSDAFRRLWTYYLAYCQAGFEAGRIDVGLYVFEPSPL
ncbi:SAM-dependent methyltransferase [Segnochrobactrum spirostomi]|nr:cyclopropane-fatty-acyl-phospholipid synthase family protein [Segnochrobactrum spirostomi]